MHIRVTGIITGITQDGQVTIIDERSGGYTARDGTGERLVGEPWLVGRGVTADLTYDGGIYTVQQITIPPDRSWVDARCGRWPVGDASWLTHPDDEETDENTDKNQPPTTK